MALQQSQPRSLLIGLDGATYDLLDPLVQEGAMPVLGDIMRSGARGVLRSTIHPLTPPAWTTMITGCNPGNHGVFDFIRVDRSGEKPSYTLATSADVMVPTIWQIASDAGLRATTLNFPVTFPARPIDGVVIPGYVPWSYLGRAIHPRSAFRLLKERGVFKAAEMSTDWQHERKAVQGLAENHLEDWVSFHITRERRWFETAMTLMEAEPSDLTAVLFDGVDRIQHLCWHLVHPDTRDDYTDAVSERVRALVLQYFSAVDGYIGEMIERAGPEAQVFIVSDHGFTRAGPRIFYANTFLEQCGWLDWVDGTPYDDQGRLALDENTEASTLIDWSRTRAYALSSSSNAIFIRRSDTPGGPGVPPQEYHAFREALREALLQVRDPRTGAPIVRHVWTREEAFPGTYCDRAPDLTLMLSDFGFLSVLRADAAVKDRRVSYATHHPDGLIVATGPGIAAGMRMPPADIADVAPTVLHGLGLPVPQGLDGRVVDAAFDADWLETHPVSMAGAAEAGACAADDSALTGDAEAQIRERLKSLGYL